MIFSLELFGMSYKIKADLKKLLYFFYRVIMVFMEEYSCNWVTNIFHQAFCCLMDASRSRDGSFCNPTVIKTLLQQQQHP